MEEDDTSLYPGPFTRALKLNYKTIFSKQFETRITEDKIQNGLVSELRSCSNTFREVAELLKALTVDGAFQSCLLKSLENKCKRTIQKIQQLNKNKSLHYDSYLKEIFIAPSGKEILPQTPSQEITINKLKRKLELEKEANDDLQRQLENIKQEETECLKELHNIINELENEQKQNVTDLKQVKRASTQWQMKFEKERENFEKLTEQHEMLKLKMSSASTRNVNKKLKRRDIRIEKQEEDLAKLKRLTEQQNKSIENTNAMLMEKEKQLSKAMKELKQVKVHKLKLQKKVSWLRSSKEQQKCKQVKENQEKISEFESKIEMYEDRIMELESLNDLMESEMIKTFQNGRYNNEVRETIMTLVCEHNVSISKVNKVIETVLSNLTGKIPECLPSNSVISRLIAEGRYVAMKQISSELLKSDANCLHSDGTTKWHRHYQGFQVTTPEGKTLSIGMDEVASGSTESLVESFNIAMKELSQTLSGNDPDEVKVASLVSSIKHTMSDQGSTNPTFNAQLQNLRSQCLEKVTKNWETLPEQVKESMADMGNFFCKMHILVNFATEADKALRIFEEHVIKSGRNPHSFNSASESGAIRLIRTACKALTTHGSDKSGVANHWQSYLSTCNKVNKLVTFRGNRFNIVFYDAAAVNYHLNDINSFLGSLPDPNQLLRSVQYDSAQQVYIAGVRALAIVDKLITGPFWRCIESAHSILDINPTLKTLYDALQKYSCDASSLLHGQKIFSDMSLHEDVLFASIFSTHDDDLNCMTQIALELILKSFVVLLDRQAKDQLPGGSYYDPSNELQSSTSHVPTTNTCSERDFAILDRLLRQKPNARTIALETFVLWTNNKPSSWLQSLNPMERDAILNQARDNQSSMQCRAKKRKEEIKQQQINILKSKQDSLQKKQEKMRQEIITLTNKITTKGGVWTAANFQAMLSKLPDSEKETAIKDQIQFQKRVLNTCAPKELFFFSSKGVKHDIKSLADNLSKILHHTQVTEDTVVATSQLIYNPPGKINEGVNQSKEEFAKKLQTQKEQRLRTQAKLSLPKYTKDPPLLVNKKIKHLFRNEDGTMEWYTGTVVALIKEHTDPLKTIFSIQYDGFPENWDFNLLMDLKKGELLIQDS